MPIVIDADGLNILSKIKNIKPNIILTPHLKEFSRLTNIDIETISQDPINIAKNYAKQYKIILLLKGPSTIITDGDKVYLINTGCSGMATAGSGDVLTGIILGLLAQGYEPETAAVMGVFIHGTAGDLAAIYQSEESLIASDIIDMLGKAFKQVK